VAVSDIVRTCLPLSCHLGFFISSASNPTLKSWSRIILRYPFLYACVYERDREREEGREKERDAALFEARSRDRSTKNVRRLVQEFKNELNEIVELKFEQIKREKNHIHGKHNSGECNHFALPFTRRRIENLANICSLLNYPCDSMYPSFSASAASSVTSCFNIINVNKSSSSPVSSISLSR